VFLRVAREKSGLSYFLDLADREGRIIEVRPNGWELAAEPPALFRRAAVQLALMNRTAPSPPTNRPRKPAWPARRNKVRGAATAQDGAATALNRILSRRCKPFESNELRDPTALAALGR
jgi:hypothetical protein